MPIMQQVSGAVVGPVVFCDVCGEEITDAGDGNVQWYMEAAQGAQSLLYFTHKRCCATFDALAIEAGAEDLGTWLVYLSHRLHFGPAARRSAEAIARVLATA